MESPWNWKSDNYLSRGTPHTKIWSDRWNWEQPKGKKQNGCHANMSARCTYLDQYLKPGTRVHAQWYRGTHKCSWVWIKNKLARKPQRQKANGRHGKTFYNTLRTLGAHNLHSLTTLQVRVDTRNIVREHLERQRTCSPRESSYVTTSTSSRIIERDYLENRRTCLPREQLREQAGVREKVLPEAEEPQKGQR